MAAWTTCRRPKDQVFDSERMVEFVRNYVKHVWLTGTAELLAAARPARRPPSREC